ncbi:MAG TPA: hypothetical protein VKA48_10730, partial [Gammaproteobacteria bacterium]|nr:hypothetical protein [Gammaproteobacteria bacterium]
MEDLEGSVREIAPTVVPTFEVVLDTAASPQVREICEAYWDYAEESGAGGTPLSDDYLRSEAEILDLYGDRFSEDELRELIRQGSRGVLRVACHDCRTPLETSG